MTLLWLACAFGALSFEPQELPGIRVGGVNPLTGQAHVNFRHADIDGNGQMDLLLPRFVVFQHEGRFATSAAVPYPEFSAVPQMDVWGKEIYLRFQTRLVILRWVDAAWVVALDQPLEWPPPQDPETRLLPEYLQAPTAAHATRFLYDFDADNEPEIVAVSPEGLHVFVRDEKEYALSAIWDVLPPLELALPQKQQIWPPAKRRLEIPLRQMACRILLSDQQVRVLTREVPAPGTCVYRVQHYTIEPGETFRTAPAGETMTAPLPEYLRPCRLNADDTVDFAGGNWALSEAAVLPRPIYATTATLDGGLDLQSRRRVGFRPHCSFIDFDGDGDHDMLTEEPDIFDGSLREAVTKFLSRAAVEHELHVYPQVSGRFTEEPRLRHRIRISLMRPPFEDGPMFQRYKANELINCTGDFNGDGYKDLAVQHSAEELAIYMAAGFGFPSRPDAVLQVPYTRTFGLADVNGDGRTDLVVRGNAAEDDPQADSVLVYMAQEE